MANYAATTAFKEFRRQLGKMLSLSGRMAVNDALGLKKHFYVADYENLKEATRLCLRAVDTLNREARR